MSIGIAWFGCQGATIEDLCLGQPPLPMMGKAGLEFSAGPGFDRHTPASCLTRSSLSSAPIW